MVDIYRKALQTNDPKTSLGAIGMASDIAKGRNDPIFFGQRFLGLQFHDRQKIWMWLTTRTQIEKAYNLAIEINLDIPTLEKLNTHLFLKNILAPGNRFGKTFLTSVKHIWYNFYKIGCEGKPEYIRDISYRTLNISPHSRQVDAAYNYIIDIFNDKFIYKWNGEQLRNHCDIKQFLVDHRKVRREIVFSNNSMIQGVPTGEDQASSLAGTQFYYISYDEAPQSLHLAEELPAKIQSRLLDTGGPMDIIGTPEVDKPSHVYYQRIVKYGLKLEKGFFTMTGGIMDNIFIGNSEKKGVLNSIKETDKEKYRQVAFGDFISSGAKLFPTPAINVIWEDYRMINNGEPNHKYIIGVDWGFSDTGDPSVFDVLDITGLINYLDGKPPLDGIHYRISYHEAVKGASPYTALAFLKLLQRDFNDADIIHDSSSMGGIIISKMLHEMKVRHLHDFSVSRSPKDEMLFFMVLVMTYGRKIKQDEEGKITELNPSFGKMRSFVIPKLEEQLGNYRLEDTGIAQDEVMALGMAIWYCEKKIAHHRTKVFDINLLASNPNEILKVNNKPSNIKVIATRTSVIKERNI